jgi:hypothetical protein
MIQKIGARILRDAFLWKNAARPQAWQLKIQSRFGNLMVQNILQDSVENILFILLSLISTFYGCQTGILLDPLA